MPVFDADAGHDAEALRLDQDLALVVLVAADHVAVVVVRAQEPLAVPAVRRRRPSPSRATGSRAFAASSSLPDVSASAANSGPMQHEHARR